VALSRAPARDLILTAMRTDGASEITVTTGAALTFTRDNFATPQTVTVAAGASGSTADRTGTITVAGSSTARTVAVTARNRGLAGPIDVPDAGGTDAGSVDGRAPDAPDAGDGGIVRDAPAGETSVGGITEEGCDCALGGRRAPGSTPLLLLLAALALATRRRRYPR
jgi:MYXO-CTERM domain-containing protein